MWGMWRMGSVEIECQHRTACTECNRGSLKSLLFEHYSFQVDFQADDQPKLHEIEIFFKYRNILKNILFNFCQTILIFYFLVFVKN